ncbi:MAG: tetratricopeptide repeat protein [Candidatus Omnitrophica bacterium]|nr:tetratricopeptide repeat protein [Candidatus Omnitrophota bacterium]
MLNSKHKNIKKMMKLSKKLRDMKNFKEEVKILQNVLRIDPKHIDALWSLGNAYLKLNCISESINSFKSCLKLNSEYSFAYHGLAVSYYHLHRYNDTIWALNQAKKIDPLFVEEACSMWADSYSSIGQEEDALELLKKIIKRWPNHKEAYGKMGFSYFGLKKFNRAILAWEKAIEMGLTDNACYKILGFTYIILKRYKDAILRLKKALKIDSNDADSHFFIGLAHGYEGRLEDEIICCKKAIELDSDYINAYNRLGCIYQKLGNKEEAEKYFAKGKALSLEE